MALMLDDKKPFYTSTESTVRVLIFAAHAVSAIFMLLKAYRVFDESGCENTIFLTSRSVIPTDSYLTAVHPQIYPVRMDRISNVTSCANDTSWNKGLCHLANLPTYIDYVNEKDSFVLGSSWNLIVLVTVFEWVTASYALLYYDPYDHWLQYDSIIWGLHPIPTFATLWNLALLIVIWVSRHTLNIPSNNAFIYTIGLASTIVIQNYLSINRQDKIDKEVDDASLVLESSRGALQLRYDGFLRNRKTTKINVGYQALRPTTTDADFHDANFIATIEKSNYGVVPRYLEYCMTAPLLFIGLYVNSVPYDLTWKLQIMFISIFVCNALGIALHQAVLLIPTDPKALVTGDPKADDMIRFTRASNYFFVGSWLSLGIAFYIFVWSLREYILESNSAMPDWVRWLIWAVLVLYSMFGIIASRYYLPRMLWATPMTEEMFKWFNFYFDVCSLAIKLPVAWTIYVKATTFLCNKHFTCPVA